MILKFTFQLSWFLQSHNLLPLVELTAGEFSAGKFFAGEFSVGNFPRGNFLGDFPVTSWSIVVPAEKILGGNSVLPKFY